MSFVADELVKWKDKPDWYSRIDFYEYERLAAIGYQPKQIAMYYHIPFDEFQWDFNLIGSPLKFHYDRGKLLQQAKEGISMSVASETGENVTQAQRFDKLRKEIAFQNAVNDIFYGDIG